jgi:hypothetical protein
MNFFHDVLHSSIIGKQELTLAYLFTRATSREEACGFTDGPLWHLHDTTVAVESFMFTPWRLSLTFQKRKEKK